MIDKYKNIIIIVVIAILAFVGYRFLFGEPSTATPTLLSDGNGNQAAVLAERELLATLLALKEIKLDAENIFEDPGFRALEDFSQELAPEPVGRLNPFAPIGVGIEQVVFEDDQTGGGSL